MSTKQGFLFWFSVVTILTLLFSTSLNSLILAFYFVSFLLPVAVSTSLFFNKYLVPQFLLTGKRVKFGLYCFYMLIGSIYLEVLVIILAFVILADYQFQNLGKIAGDIYLMAIILYLIVFSHGLILVFKKLKQKEELLAGFEEKEKRNKESTLLIKENRQNVQLTIDDITYVESLSDYVKIHTVDGVHVTKEKISALENSLPTHFIRIHRSFLVNRNHIASFSKEVVQVAGEELTIGRKYKQEVSSALS